MKVIILDEALAEFEETAIYYEEKEPGLGLRFKGEVEKAVSL